MLDRLGRTEVALGKLLVGKVEPSTHHPGRENHQASDDNNNDTHERHHEPNVILVLRVFLLALGLGRGQLTSDLALSGLGGLSGEDRFDELLDLATDDADLEEVGVLGGVLLVDFAGVLPETVAKNAKVLGRLVHKLTCLSLGDLDVLLENVGVAETQFHGRDSHGLRDGAEVEDTLLAETSEVEETLLTVLQGIQNHLGAAVESGIEMFGLEKILEVVDVLGPNLLRPESTVVVEILADVSDDVGLLEEKSHGLVESWPLQKSGVTELSLHKQPGETFADQTGNIVAVQVVLLLGFHAGIISLGLDRIVGHTIAHPFGDVLNDGLVLRLHVNELSDDVVELNQQFTILLLGPVAGEVPALFCEDVLEVPQKGLFGGQRNGGVILDGVQSTEDQIEDANRDQKFRVELLDDSTETPTGLFEEFEAKLLVFGFVLFVALMGRIVPNFPARGGKVRSGQARKRCAFGDLPLDDCPQLHGVEGIIEGIADETHDGRRRRSHV